MKSEARRKNPLPDNWMSPTKVILRPEDKVTYKEFLDIEGAILAITSAGNFADIVLQRKKLLQIMSDLQEIGLKMLENNLPMFTQRSIDKRMWKVLVYDYVVAEREYIQNRKTKDSGSDFVTLVIERSLKYFEELLRSIEKSCEITTNSYTGESVFHTLIQDEPETAQFAKILYPRIIISIGDTRRYNLKDPNYWYHAMEEYDRARSIDPTVGHSFHQMGVVTLARKDMLSSAYNFTRAYAAPVPSDGSRQQLLIVYDINFKTYKTSCSSYWFAKSKRPESPDRTGVRRQIWIFTGGPKINPPPAPETPDTKETHFQSLNSREIWRRFATSYVEFIGKLFTNIGTESLNVVAEESLVYFEGFLKNGDMRTVLPLRFLQILTLIMYIIDYLHPESTNYDDALTSSELVAIQFAFEMVGIMAQRLSRLIDICDWDNPQMECLCIALQIWVDWMRLKTHIWARRRPRPRFSVLRVESTKQNNSLDNQDDVWVHFADLISKIEIVVLKFKNILFPSISEYENSRHTICLTPFFESINLFGFPSFEGARIFTRKYYCDDSRAKPRARNLIRLMNIHEFGITVLRHYKVMYPEAGLYQVRKYQSDMHVHRPKNSPEICGLDETNYHYWMSAFKATKTKEDDEKRNRPKSNTSIPKPDCNNASRTIVLRPRPENPSSTSETSLPPARPQMPNYEKWLYCSDKGFRTEIIVMPKRIVLDTNCFIRKLSLVQLLITMVEQPIFIPVSVILELKGLSKGGLSAKDQERYGTVHDLESKERLIRSYETAENCKAALTYINEHMNYFHIVTSTARILKIKNVTAKITDDYLDPTMTNDDRILDTCKFLEAKDLQARALDTPRRIYRSTLLVTGDRFLRIKTYTMDIPSRPLSSIVFWFTCHHFSVIHTLMLKISKDDRHKAFKRRQQIRYQKAIL